MSSLHSHIKFTDSSGKVWPVPADLFTTYAERVTLYTDDAGRSQVSIFRPVAGSALLRRGKNRSIPTKQPA